MASPESRQIRATLAQEPETAASAAQTALPPMTTIPVDETRLKALLKEALVEVLDQRRDWFVELVAEVVEDIALVQAIKESETTETVSRTEIFSLLAEYGDIYPVSAPS